MQVLCEEKWKEIGVWWRADVLFNPFPNKPWFLRVCSTSLLKTLWEKEKLFITSNFSFSHSVFYLFEDLSSIFIKFEIVVCIPFHFGRVFNLSFGKGLKRFIDCMVFNALFNIISPISWRPEHLSMLSCDSVKQYSFQAISCFPT